MINQAALDLIKQFEGFRAEAYLDPVSVWTIGYGTTAAAEVGITPKLGMKITEAQAEGYLDAAVTKFAHQITAKIKRPINENQFGAFVSLAYNIGPGAFARSSALDKFNDGDIQGAADCILLWNKAGGKVLRGLERRRQAERALFLEPVKGRKPTGLNPPKSSPQALPPLRPVPPKTFDPSWVALALALLAAAWAWLTKG